MAQASRSLRLESWSRGHALGSLAALASSIVIARAWPLSIAALLSFTALLAHRDRRRAWTPAGDFGAANAVTCLRLALVSALGVSPRATSALLLAAVALAVFALDGLDGLLARRSGRASAFGAHFDMETDATFVLMLGLLLWQRAELGVWVLSSGVLRYVYVLCIALFPPRVGEMPRSRLGRYAFATLVVGLVAGLVLPAPFSVLAAALGTSAVLLSFARSFYWSYVRKPASTLGS